MADKKQLAALLAGGAEIRRGQGVRLSTGEGTDITAKTQKRINAGTHKRRNAATQRSVTPPTRSKRVNRGYMLREDLIKQLKLIAVTEDRNLYAVMEEALEAWLRKRKTK